MATVSQRRGRRQGTFESQRVAVRRRKPRKWVKRVVLGGALLATIVLLLPNIIALTGLRNAPLRLALQGIHGSVQAGGASLSWFGPIRYSDIEIRDAEGKSLLAIPSIESERTLLALIANLKDLGVFRIEKPQVSLVVRHDGSNFEDVFKPVVEKAEKSPKVEAEISHPPAMTVEIIDGTVQLTDVNTSEQWKLDKFNFKLQTSSESSLPIDLALNTQLIGNGTTSQIAINGKPAEAGVNGSALDQIEAKIDALPLAAFRPLIDRFAPGLQLAGTISTNIVCTGITSISSGKMTVAGGIAADNVSATGGPLGSDRFAQQRIELPCKMVYQNCQLDIEQLGLQCDVGNLSVVGSAMIPEQFDGGALPKLLRSTFQVQGQLDLAKLAALLPSTLRVQQGTQITSGQISLTLASKPDVAAHTWSGQLLASNLSAVQNGRAFQWQNPIDLQVAARDQNGVYSIDQLLCQSGFLALKGGGSLDQFQVEANYDLNRLMTEASQFVDLGELRLAGRGQGQFSWQRTAAGEFQANGGAQVQALQIAIPGRPVWQEESVSASLSASGMVDAITFDNLATPNLRRLNTAQASVTFDNPTVRTRELVEVKLLQPIEQFSAHTRWPLDVRMQGRLDQLWPQVAGWLGVSGLELGGTADIAVQAAYSDAAVEIQNAKATFNQLHAWGWNTFFIDEPTVQLEASGGYEFAASKLTLNRTSLLTSSLSLQTDAATVAMPATGPMNLQGAVAYQADLARLIRWITDPRTPPSYAMVGILSGTATMARTGSTTDGRIDAAVNNFAVYVHDSPSSKSLIPAPGNAAPTPEPVWTEPKLTLAVNGRIDEAADVVQLTSFNVGSQAFTMNAGGGIERLSSQKIVNLSGKIDYDWQQIGPLLKPYLGSSVKIVGKHSRKFSVQGPLGEATGSGDLAARLASAKNAKSKKSIEADSFAFLQPLTADVSLGWQRADVYGMRIGKLDFDAHLQDGAINTQPIEATIGREEPLGKLTAAPVVRLTPNPAELTIGKGPLLSNVRISQELSNTWMKFVTPILAEATRAEGIFSLELDGARVPLMNPDKADLGGKLTVHNVTITPGPMLQPLVLICQQIEAIVKKRPPPVQLGREATLLTMDNQKVDFRLVEGRVYHQDLHMTIGSTPIRTRGWVGLDESINIIAEVPLRKEWIQNNPALANNREQMLQIPITGTLRKWKIDDRVIQQLVGQFIQGTTRGLIEGELNKQLDRLLPLPQQR